MAAKGGPGAKGRKRGQMALPGKSGRAGKARKAGKSKSRGASEGAQQIKRRMISPARAMQQLGTNDFAISLPWQGIEATLDAGGVWAQRGDEQLFLTFTAWGREGDLEPVSEVEPVLGACADEGATSGCVQRLEYGHPSLIHWWAGRSDGLQQGWTVQQRPEAGVSLSDRQDCDPSEARMALVGGKVITRCPADAAPLAFEVEFMELQSLKVNKRGKTARLVGPEGDSWYYGHVKAWDANGKSLPVWLEATGDRQLTVLVDDTWARYPITVDPLLTTAPTTLSDQGYFGWSVAGAGDVDGDGYDDVIVGGPFNASAYIFLGASGGISAKTNFTLSGSDDFGQSVAGAGDVNGDGFGDVIVGQPTYAGYSGAAFVHHGSAAGPSTTADTSILYTPAIGQATMFGAFVAGAGDINGDGFDDVIVGMEGVAAVFYGSATGISTVPDTELPFSTSFPVVVAAAGDVNGDGFDDVIVAEDSDVVSVLHGSASGLAVIPAASLVGAGYEEALWISAAGDVDADGFDDVIVGGLSSSGYGTTGEAYVYHGSATGVSETAVTTLSEGKGTYYGWSVAGVGDIDGDGYDEVMVGDPLVASAWVYKGSATGTDPTSVQTLTGSNYFGWALAHGGDVNGDSFPNVVVGDPASDEAYGYERSHDADDDGHPAPDRTGAGAIGVAGNL